MRTSRFSREQKLALLERVQAETQRGRTIASVLSEADISPATYFRWKKAAVVNQYGIAERGHIWELARAFRSAVLPSSATAAGRQLRDRIANLCIRIFARPPIRRLRKISPELKRLASAVEEAVQALDSVPRDERLRIDELYEPRFPRAQYTDLLERLDPFSQRLRVYSRHLGEYAISIGDASGGPTHDPRIPQLIVGLAHIFCGACGEEPSHAIHPVTEKPTSRFNNFVIRVMRHFLPEIPIKPSAVRTAMRHVAARVNYGGRRTKRRLPRRRNR